MAISSPEPQPDPWDPETLAAWEAWETLSELAWPEMPKSYTEETFWSFWDQRERLFARQALFRFMSKPFSELDLTRDQYPKWHIVNEWMRETRAILDAEEVRQR